MKVRGGFPTVDLDKLPNMPLVGVAFLDKQGVHTFQMTIHYAVGIHEPRGWQVCARVDCSECDGLADRRFRTQASALKAGMKFLKGEGYVER